MPMPRRTQSERANEASLRLRTRHRVLRLLIGTRFRLRRTRCPWQRARAAMQPAQSFRRCRRVRTSSLKHSKQSRLLCQSRPYPLLPFRGSSVQRLRPQQRRNGSPQRLELKTLNCREYPRHRPRHYLLRHHPHLNFHRPPQHRHLLLQL